MKTDNATTAACGFGFLDHPMESKTSTIKFFVALSIFIGAVLVIARSYYNTVTFAWFSSCQCDREHRASCGLTAAKSQSAADAHLQLLISLQITGLLPDRHILKWHQPGARNMTNTRHRAYLPSGWYVKVVSHSVGEHLSWSQQWREQGAA